MSEYTPPLQDILFVLNHVVDLPALCELDDFSHIDPDTVGGVLEECGRFMSEVVAPLNRIGDVEGATHNPDNTVSTPAAFAEAYNRYVDAGWNAVAFPSAYGGGGFPWLIGIAMQEMLTSACMAFSLAPLLTQGAIDALLNHGTEEQKEAYLPKMVTGEWTGTMNLTEPQAGSDVGALTTRAVRADDGSYRITGTKIFITYGEHNLTDQIVHLVLARAPDAPPGTKGISCFIVPKFVPQPDGSPGERNDVTCVSIEHKLGIHACPTCVLSYGDAGEGAVGYLIGEECQGMRYMFTMMNNARLSVGLEGVSLGERAYQQALEYAQERRQGRAIGAPAGEPSPIIDHPDVRRMLMTMKSSIDAARCIAYLNGWAIDWAKHHPDEAERERGQELADILTPVTKAWGTDTGVAVASLGVQVHGGMGFIEETGAAQHLRDIRIAPIYEGTNGIQAADLVGRKLGMRKGAAVVGVLDWFGAVDADLAAVDLDDLRAPLSASLSQLREATEWLLVRGSADPNDALAGSSPYLEMFGLVAGAHLLARSAVAAQRLLAAGEGDAGFLAAKVATARFFCAQLLPKSGGLMGAVTGGAGMLFEIEPKYLGV